jgi:hypothetical protein
MTELSIEEKLGTLYSEFIIGSGKLSRRQMFPILGATILGLAGIMAISKDADTASIPENEINPFTDAVGRLINEPSDLFQFRGVYDTINIKLMDEQGNQRNHHIGIDGDEYRLDFPFHEKRFTDDELHIQPGGDPAPYLIFTESEKLLWALNYNLERFKQEGYSPAAVEFGIVPDSDLLYNEELVELQNDIQIELKQILSESIPADTETFSINPFTPFFRLDFSLNIDETVHITQVQRFEGTYPIFQTRINGNDYRIRYSTVDMRQNLILDRIDTQDQIIIRLPDRVPNDQAVEGSIQNLYDNYEETAHEIIMEELNRILTGE